MQPTSSFNVLDVLDDGLPSLLADLLSLPSLASLDSDLPPPPFPSRPVRPISPLLVYRRSSLLPPTPDVRDLNITVSSPTVPRIASVIHEPMRVTQWLGEVIPVDPAGDIPWGGVRPTRAEIWRPKGSLYSPGEFRKALKAARNRGRSQQPLCSTPFRAHNRAKRLLRQPASHTQPPFRKTVVFKREITLDADGNAKRLSLEVPATTMDPEIVDMMLELQGLNSFFKNGPRDFEEAVATLEQQDHTIHPPSLIVSDSQNVVPVMLDSPRDNKGDASVSLAARRGKNLLPQLSITSANQATGGNSYPSIPSAFLGSPSTYSPKRETFGIEDESLDLEDMITALRSKITFPVQSSPEVSDIVESPVSAMSFALPPDQTENGDDDWGFAISLLTEFGSQPSQIVKKMDLIDNARISPQDELPGMGLDLAIAEHPLTPTVSCTTQNASASMGCPSNTAPATPLPLTPPASPAHRPPSPKSVRGILKSCKNVRFASLPEKPSDFRIDPIPSSPPLPSSSHLRRPLRTRTIYRTSKVSPETPRSPVTQVPASSYLPTLPQPRVVPVQIDGLVTNSLPTPRSLPPSPIEQSFPHQTNSPLSGTISPPLPSPPDSSAPIPARNSASPSVSARKSISLGRGIKTTTADKENTDSGTKPVASAFKQATASRWTMNDMTFKRGSTGQPSPAEGTPKSRMPVPLRSIWTRFK